MDVYEKVDVLKDELLKRDSYWKKCYPCINNGKCCRNADVDVTESEWKRIVTVLQKRPHLYSFVKNQYLKKRHCIFYSSSLASCSIHEERPLMCRYTPFQMVSINGKTFCNELDDDCDHIHDVEVQNVEKLSSSFVTHAGRTYVMIDEVPEIVSYKKNKTLRVSDAFYHTFIEPKS
jgi:Fe-S-cluster containining protein